MVSFGFVYIFTTVRFAALYPLEPGSIQGDTDPSFADAFYFSVQALDSLGDVAMTPATTWADLWVTLEVAIDRLFAAMATGLIFAKAARPTSRVLWAKHCVVTEGHGTPTLLLSVANARGNEVVDTNLTLAVLIDEISPEDHHMRRLHDLKPSARTPPYLPCPGWPCTSSTRTAPRARWTGRMCSWASRPSPATTAPTARRPMRA